MWLRMGRGARRICAIWGRKWGRQGPSIRIMGKGAGEAGGPRTTLAAPHPQEAHGADLAEGPEGAGLGQGEPGVHQPARGRLLPRDAVVVIVVRFVLVAPGRLLGPGEPAHTHKHRRPRAQGWEGGLGEPRACGLSLARGAGRARLGAPARRRACRWHGTGRWLPGRAEGTRGRRLSLQTLPVPCHARVNS